MKKVLLFSFLLVGSFCFGQEKQIDMQDWFRKGLNVILENNSSKDKKYNCYFKNNELYVVYETFINIPYSDIMERETEIKDLSKEMAYRTTDIFKSAISDDYEKIYKSKYINIKYTILTGDYKNISYDYFFNANELYKISPYFNKKDFLEILK